MAQSYFKITLDNGTTPLVLSHNPAGILDLEITWKRHEIYGTLFRSVGSSLRFVKEGADYLKTIWEANGIDGDCAIEIQSLNFENKTYSTIYTGIIDFSNYREDIDFIEVGILDKSVMSKFLAREKTNVNIIASKNIDNNTITTTTPSPRVTVLTPINPVTWSDSSGAESALVISSGLTSNFSQTITPTGATSPNLLGSDYDTSILKYTNSDPTLSRQIDFYTKYRTVITGLIDVTDPGSPPGSITFDFKLKKYDGGTTVQSYSVTTDPVVGQTTLSFDNSVDTIISSLIAAGNSQGLYTEITVTFDSGVVGSVTFDYKTTFETYLMEWIDNKYTTNTSVRTYKVIDVGNMILERMGIDTTATPFSSIQFEPGGIFENYVITSGRRIRQFPDDDPINLSFRDFYFMLRNVFGMLLEYNNSEFRAEPHNYFYGSSGGVTPINPSKFVYSTAEDKYFSSIKIGYENHKYKEINGNIEFNGESEYATINKNTNNILDFTSPVRADSIGMELLRRKQYHSTADEDVDGDSDIFVMNTIYDSSLSSWRVVKGSDMSSVSGIRHPDQYYNYEITPKQNLVRQGFLLNTTLRFQTKQVTFIKSMNNIPLVVDGLPEQDGDYNSVGSGSVTPIYIEFEFPNTETFMNKFLANPNYRIDFTFGGSNLAVFCEEVTFKPYENSIKLKGMN